MAGCPSITISTAYCCSTRTKRPPCALRITSKFQQGYDTLPEMSPFYDTDRFIPTACIEIIPRGRDLRVQINVPAAQSNIVAHAKLPYGAMLWGDYSKFSLPADAPTGAQIDGASRQFCGGLQTLGDALTPGFHLRAIHLLTL